MLVNTLVSVGARPAPVIPVSVLTTMPVVSIEAGLDERPQRQRRRRHVAAGGGDEAGALQLGAVQFGQAEHGLFQQVELGVLEPVERRVGSRVLQAERRRQVDDAADVADQRRREFHRGAVRQPEEHEVEPVDRRGVELGEHQVGVRRPASDGYRSAARRPAIESPVATTTSKSGCCAAIRSSSAPVYPDAPMIRPTDLGHCMTIHDHAWSSNYVAQR